MRVCDALIVALTGRNVTSVSGSRMKDKPQPAQIHTHTHHSQKKMWPRVSETVTEGREEHPLPMAMPPTLSGLTFSSSKIL